MTRGRGRTPRGQACDAPGQRAALRAAPLPPSPPRRRRAGEGKASGQDGGLLLSTAARGEAGLVGAAQGARVLLREAGPRAAPSPVPTGLMVRARLHGAQRRQGAWFLLP